MSKINIVSYSGGIGSGMTADLVRQKYGCDNTLMLFADTNMEDEDLYRFNKELSEKLDVMLITIADGRDVWQVFNDVKFIGNSRVDPCSRILKRDLIKKWILSNFDPEEVDIFVGIDCTEEHRLERIKTRNTRLNYRSILIEQNIFLDKRKKFDWCESLNIQIPRLYTLGFLHNNCGGFCVKAGLKQFKQLYTIMPDRYKWHEDREQALMSSNPKLKPFLRKTIDNKLYYLSLKEYRITYLEQGTPLQAEEEFDWGGCGCAID